eukprot:Awhi_evm2s4030
MYFLKSFLPVAFTHAVITISSFGTLAMPVDVKKRDITSVLESIVVSGVSVIDSESTDRILAEVMKSPQLTLHNVDDCSKMTDYCPNMDSDCNPSFDQTDYDIINAGARGIADLNDQVIHVMEKAGVTLINTIVTSTSGPVGGFVAHALEGIIGIISLNVECNGECIWEKINSYVAKFVDYKLVEYSTSSQYQKMIGFSNVVNSMVQQHTTKTDAGAFTIMNPDNFYNDMNTLHLTMIENANFFIQPYPAGTQYVGNMIQFASLHIHVMTALFFGSKDHFTPKFQAYAAKQIGCYLDVLREQVSQAYNKRMDAIPNGVGTPTTFYVDSCIYVDSGAYVAEDKFGKCYWRAFNQRQYCSHPIYALGSEVGHDCDTSILTQTCLEAHRKEVEEAQNSFWNTMVTDSYPHFESIQSTINQMKPPQNINFPDYDSTKDPNLKCIM